LAEATRGVAVVAEDDGLVVQGHASDGVIPPAGACGTSTPGIPAQHHSRSCAHYERGCGRWRRRRKCARGPRRRRAWRARPRGRLSHRFRAPAHDRGSPRTADQPEQPSTADRLGASAAPARSNSVHYKHHTKRTVAEGCNGETRLTSNEKGPHLCGPSGGAAGNRTHFGELVSEPNRH